MIPESPVAIPERELEFIRDAENAIVDYASDISNGKITLVELIQKLGHYMVDPDEFKRYQGTYILVEVLDKIPSSLLNSNETEKLVSFFCERLKDHFMLLPVVLKGLVALMTMENISTSDPMDVLSKLSDDVVCQSLSQSNRHNFYSLFKLIHQHHKDGIADKDMEFIRYLVNAMDGESDPRNLMLLFRFIPNILRHSTLTDTLVEEMFSVLECYFPVDFTPSSKFMITREDLKEGLEDCLTATPAFFPYSLPLILEKLDSKLKTALVDSLQLLIRECRMWGGDSLKDQLNTLWTSIQDLIFSGGDAEISNLAIQAVSVVISSSANSPNMKPHLEKCLELVSGSKTLLMDPSLNLFRQAMKLQGALSLSSSVSAEHIMVNVLPHVLNVLDYEKQYKDVVLSSLLPIIEGGVNFDLWQYGKPEVQSELNKLPDVLFKYIEVQKLRPFCTDGFKLLLPNLTREQRVKLYSFIKSSKSGDKVSSLSELNLIKEIAKLFPEEIISDLLDNLSSVDSIEGHSRNVEILSWSCHVPLITKYCCNKIVKLLESNNFPETTIRLLRDSCESIENADVLRLMGSQECQLIDQLLMIYCKDKLKSDNSKDKMSINMAKIFQCIVASMESSEQTELISRCLESFFTKFTFEENSLLELSSQIILLEGVIGALHCDVTIPKVNIVVGSLIYLSLNSDEYLYKLSSSRLSASIFNKQHNDELLASVVSTIISEIENNKSNSKGKNGVYLASWICKALVLSNHPTHAILLEKLISLLACKELCMGVAEGFKIILTDSEDYLNRQCHAKIGILYKQRVFENISKLIDLQDSVEGICSSAVNLTIAYLLKYSPPQLVIYRLKELNKIILRCLDNDDVSVSLSTLEVIASLLAIKTFVFEEYTSDLIPRCLKLSTSGSMDVRIAALECLCLYSQFNKIVILPYRDQVITRLVKCLDDKKRLVRQKAVEARSKWYLLGAV